MKMKFEKTKTNRGFALNYFNDDYGEKCSLQESSSVEPHIWLGIDEPRPMIMCSDARKLELPYAKNACGWQEYKIPKEVLIHTRMHLTKRQSFRLAMKLLKFALFGKV